MLSTDKYQFMKPLNDFRTLLMATRFDMSKRDVIGRTISEAGYVQIRPDVYSLAFRQDLLRYLLTIDAQERERAEAMEADLLTGRVEDTPKNRMLASPMFAFVSLPQLALVDFYWGLHPYAQHAFPALAIWYDVHVLGRRYPIPSLPPAEPHPVPAPRWYPVGKLDREAPAEGLANREMQEWNRYLHPERTFHSLNIQGEKTVWFAETDSLGYDAFEVCAFITLTYPEMHVECSHPTGLESSQFWLNEGLLSLPAGQSARYQHMARRGQYFARLAQRLNLAPQELDEHLLRRSIPDAEHNLLLQAQSQDAPQAALFN